MTPDRLVPPHAFRHKVHLWLKHFAPPPAIPGHAPVFVFFGQLIARLIKSTK